MSEWIIAAIIRPVVVVAGILLLFYCVRRPIERRMKDGALKRFLLTPITSQTERQD